MKIFLTGMMGSGKSHWMRKLSTRLSVNGYDLDTLVEQREQKTVAQIFDENGEDYFRQAESRALRSLVAEDEFILSTGGGAPCYHDNMNWMNEQGLTIFLDEPVDQLVDRVTPGKSRRPLIAGVPAEQLHSWLEQKRMERIRWYEMSRVILRGSEINEASILEKIQQYFHA